MQQLKRKRTTRTLDKPAPLPPQPPRPRIYLDEATCRAHNAGLDAAAYNASTSEATGIWDLPFRATAALLPRVEHLTAADAVAAPAELVRVHVEAKDEDIARVTSAKYRAWLARDEGRTPGSFLDRDKTTMWTEGTLQAARCSAGAVLDAAEHVFATSDSGVRRAFVVVRPPGHHNSCGDIIEDYFDVDDGVEGNFVWGCHGGCIYNNVAMAIRKIQSERRVRFAVVDLDAHFGDGTALHFWHDPSVLTISIHWGQSEAGNMYPFLQGGPDERGGEGAEGACLNLPLPDDSDDVALATAMNNALMALRAFQPEGIFVACGFDALDVDLSSPLKFTPEGYGKALTALIEAYPGVPLLATWEGGYTTMRQADAFEQVIYAMRHVTH